MAKDNKASVHLRVNLRRMFDIRPIPPPRTPRRAREEIAARIDLYLAQEAAAGREPTREGCWEAVKLDASQDPPAPFCSQRAARPVIEEKVAAHTAGRPRKSVEPPADG
jgi:hypothetical protein